MSGGSKGAYSAKRGCLTSAAGRCWPEGGIVVPFAALFASTDMKERTMRAACLGLLLLFASAAGCADLDSGGFMENYNGFPWPWLLTKGTPQSRTNASVQNLQFSETGRFTPQQTDPTDTGSSSKTTPIAQTPAGESPAEE
jgi:hypothetical protein